MAKSRQQLEKDANALIKLILSEMEGMVGTAGLDVYEFDEKRRNMVRKVWNLVKECLAYDPRGEL